MGKAREIVPTLLKTVFGCLLFGLGFDLFLEPSGLNAGGISGLAMAFVHLTGVGSVGAVTLVMNLPLFALAGIKVGRKFFFGSLLGMFLSSAFIDLLVFLPSPQLQPLLGALYGGALCGLGAGLVFAAGHSTGGSDIVVRVLNLKWRNVPIGVIDILFDLLVATVTGLVFRDVEQALYSGVAIFVSGQVIDAVVYRFDYSRVALIVSRQYDVVAGGITQVLRRGVTFLHAEGGYTHNRTKVILTAVKKQQLAQLKELVASIDPDAFIIVQEAHQVLGDGFARYSKDGI